MWPKQYHVESSRQIDTNVSECQYENNRNNKNAADVFDIDCHIQRFFDRPIFKGNDLAIDSFFLKKKTVVSSSLRNSNIR